jgi:uncharacterized cupredoxin-like copper-binding protein
LVALPAIASCTADADAPAAAGSTVSITTRDFAFSIEGADDLHAGDVTFDLENQGPNTHELVVVRSDGADLPIRADGITVDEEAIEPRIAGAWEDAKPGTRDQLQLHLEPGRYVLFCNMAGHYLGGMHDFVEVH